jgi:hypothetical protein
MIAPLWIAAVFGLGGGLLVSTTAGAAEACTGWTAEMVEEEGGPVLAAYTCSDDAAAAYLSLMCVDGTVVVANDLAAGMNIAPDPDLGLKVPVEFATAQGSAEMPLEFSQMTAMFVGETPAKGELVGLLKSGASVEVRDPAGVFPARTYPLEGAAEAIGTLLEGCQ